MRVLGIIKGFLVVIALGLVARSVPYVTVLDIGSPAASVNVTQRDTPIRADQALRAVQTDAAKVHLRYSGADSLTKLAADTISAAELAALDVSRRTLEAAAPDYVSSRLGFEVYGASTAAGLYIVERKAASRLLAMGGRSGAAVRGELDAWGLGLRATTADRVPSTADVARAIEQMSLPRGSLAGLRVFILPFSLMGTSGLSWPDIVVVGSRPPDYETIDTQLEFTVAHEIGHIVHYRAMGPAGSDAWKEYMRLRGIPKWRSGGSALTAAWETSVEESFAEDVRVLLGGSRSAQADHGTIHGDPRVASGLGARLASFIGTRIASAQAESRETSAREVFAGASSHLM